MANRYAVATGNWSDPTIWDGGTLPQAGDVVRPNGFTVTIDQDITVDELTNNALAPAVARGNLVIEKGVEINADIINRSSTNSYIFSTAAWGDGLTIINGNVLHLSQGTNSRVLAVNGSAGGELVVNGDIYHGATIGNDGLCAIALNGNGNGFKVVSNGLVSGTRTTSNAQNAMHGIRCESGYVIDVNGVCEGQQSSGAASRFSNGINITGSSNVVNVHGIVRGGLLAQDLSRSGIRVPNNLNNEIRIYGLAEATLLPAVIGGLVRYMNGAVVKDGTTMMAIQALAQFVNAVGDDVQFILPVDAVDAVSLYTAGLLTGYPPENKVEENYTYGPSGEFTGTLVPVNVDVQQLASDLLTEMETSNLPIAVRMRNTATDAFVTAALAAITPAP